MLHHQDTKLKELIECDFIQIQNHVLYDDVHLLNGECRSQKKGIAMGNCAAPALAIIFMDAVERCIIGQCAEIKL